MRTINVIEGIFFAALEKPNAERAAYLDEACQGDAELRRAVERMLAAHPRVGDFMEVPAGGLSPTVDLPPLSEQPGTVIGPYKLLQELGEGGFGIVFLAEQHEPVCRMVALKVLKPGMDSQQVLARFEQERQALALMDHPNIARVLDGGTTASGRPFLVMELVKGVPITKFCDDNRLTPPERLALFVQACAAVQHAHTKGVIHRDIKPSNVMVATYDDRPVVKVIDFGVAKAIDQKLTEQTLFTRVGQVVGTYEYMSPEQASLNALDVDTRSDVYTLGVLLYKLLTGSTPFDRQQLLAAGFAEMLRLIREEEPPPPSARLSSSGQALPQLAAFRRTDSAKLGPMLRGELDWITMKALEKDRTRRYQSAAALADDIGRYLRDEPVEACPPSWDYRAAKFARKHRTVLSLAGTAAALLLLGVILSGWQAWRATTAESNALTQRDEANKARLAEAEQRRIAVARGEELRRSRYGLSMGLIQSAANAGNYARATELLEEQRPGPDEEDLRGFEWHYWDRRLNQQLRTVSLRGGIGATLSGDGRRVAYWHIGPNREAVLEVAETAMARVLFSHTLKQELRGLVRPLSLSHDGARVACLLSEGITDKDEVAVFDVDAGKSLFVCKGYAMNQFALARDGRRLATTELVNLPRAKLFGQFLPASRDYHVKLWDVDAPAGEPICCREMKAVQVRQPALSADGTRIAVVSFRSWDAVDPSELHVWETKGQGHLQAKASSGVVALAFSPDGSRLTGILNPTGQSPFVREDLKTIEWNWAGGKLEELRATPLAIGERAPLLTARLVYSPDGRRLAVLGSSIPGVRILETNTGVETQAIETPQRLANVAFDQDGTRLFTVGTPGRSLFDVASRQEPLVWQEWPALVSEPAAPRDAVTEQVIWSRDGQRQAVYQRTVGGVAGPTAISIRDRAGKEIHVFREHARWVNNVRFSRDGRLVYSFSMPSEVWIWETETGKILYRYAARATGIMLPLGTVSDDGRFLIRLGDEGGTVVRFEDGLRELFAVGPFSSARFSPDSRRLVTSHRPANKGVGPGVTPARHHKLWDVETGRLIGTLPDGHPKFSPDGRSLIVSGPTFASAEECAVFDAITGKTRVVLKGRAGAFGVAVFNHDATRLILRPLSIAGDLEPPSVWDLETGAELFRLEGHIGRVGACVFSGDSKRIATTASDRAGRVVVKLYDAQDGREMLSVSLAGKATPELTLAFSDDGHKLTLTRLQNDVEAGKSVFDATPRKAAR